jgi:hypothetical protein
VQVSSLALIHRRLFSNFQIADHRLGVAVRCSTVRRFRTSRIGPRGATAAAAAAGAQSI